jgi:hypothetical protein
MINARRTKKAAANTSLLQSVTLNDHEPFEHFKIVMTRLPTHPYWRIEDLLQHL